MRRHAVVRWYPSKSHTIELVPRQLMAVDQARHSQPTTYLLTTRYLLPCPVPLRRHCGISLPVPTLRPAVLPFAAVPRLLCAPTARAEPYRRRCGRVTAHEGAYPTYSICVVGCQHPANRFLTNSIYRNRGGIHQRRNRRKTEACLVRVLKYEDVVEKPGRGSP